MMSPASAPDYSHVQRAPLGLIFYAVGGVPLVLAWLSRNDLGAVLVLGLQVALFLVLGRAFEHLHVVDRGDRLRIAFGPLPLFRRTVSYNEILSVARGRTSILSGWGIHYSLRGGWVWNLWGFDCVVLRMRRGRVLRIGTDDPEGLLSFLARRIGQDTPPAEPHR